MLWGMYLGSKNIPATAGTSQLKCLRCFMCKPQRNKLHSGRLFQQEGQSRHTASQQLPRMATAGFQARPKSLIDNMFDDIQRGMATQQKPLDVIPQALPKKATLTKARIFVPKAPNHKENHVSEVIVVTTFVRGPKGV